MNRYDLDVYHDDLKVYSASFTSINHLVRFACGFDRKSCELIAFDILFVKSIPIYELCDEFEGANYGI